MVAASFLAPILTSPDTRWTIRNVRSHRTLADRLEAAFDSPSRNKGLLGRDSLPEGQALILAPCNSIHTFFMRFSIDVLFMARDGRVLKLARALPGWRIAFSWRASAVVELPAGAIERSDTQVGDLLELSAG
jgi:uncharacterized membrane protein (UPF0127 family)